MGQGKTGNWLLDAVSALLSRQGVLYPSFGDG